MTATLNGSRAVSVRLVLPWRGPWFADVDVDPDDPSAPLTGAVSLAAGGAALKGTIDPRYSGRFASAVRARVLAGAAGWDKSVSPRPWHNDAGVQSTLVYQATASEVGETVVDGAPVVLGPHFLRTAGPASRVFGDRDWYVGTDGITKTSARPTLVPDKTFEVLSYDPQLGLIEASCDALVLPGTSITDKRFDAALVARDVEQTFTKDGARVRIWCGSAPASRLAGALKTAVREFAGVKYLRLVEYRFVSATVDRLNLQIVDKADGFPDALPIPVWPGMAGLSAKLTLSQGVLVGFVDGDPTKPRVVSFDGTLPQEVSVDAVQKVHLAPSKGTGQPVARAGDAVQVYLDPTALFAGLINGTVPVTGTITFVNPALGIILEGSANVDST